MKKKVALALVFCIIVTAMIVVTGFSATNPKEEEGIFQRVSFTDAQISASDVNLREGTSLEHKVTCTLDKGTDVKVLGKLGNWYAVYVPSKETVGVTDSKYIKAAGEANASNNATAITAKVAAAAKAIISVPSINKDEQAMLERINEARKDAGLENLQIDSSLQKVAKIKAKDMAENEYFSHKSPTYGSPFDLMRRNGVTFKSAGENISGNESYDAAAKAWMDSDNHKANILNGNYNYVGIGIADDKTYGKIFVTEFIEK